MGQCNIHYFGRLKRSVALSRNEIGPKNINMPTDTLITVIHFLNFILKGNCVVCKSGLII